MPLLRYRYPFVANEESIPRGKPIITKEDSLYFYVDYVKPGRTNYVIQHEKNLNKRKSFAA